MSDTELRGYIDDLKTILKLDYKNQKSQTFYGLHQGLRGVFDIYQSINGRCFVKYKIHICALMTS
jgi:hypothetical protein